MTATVRGLFTGYGREMFREHSAQNPMCRRGQASRSALRFAWVGGSDWLRAFSIRCRYRRTALSPAERMDHVNSRGHMFDGSRRQNSVAQIKNMPRTSAGSPQNICRVAFGFMTRAKQM